LCNRTETTRHVAFRLLNSFISATCAPRVAALPAGSPRHAGSPIWCAFANLNGRCFAHAGDFHLNADHGARCSAPLNAPQCMIAIRNSSGFGFGFVVSTSRRHPGPGVDTTGTNPFSSPAFYRRATSLRIAEQYQFHPHVSSTFLPAPPPLFQIRVGWRAAATRKQLHPACRWKRSCRLFRAYGRGHQGTPAPALPEFPDTAEMAYGSVSTPCWSRATTLNWNHCPNQPLGAGPFYRRRWRNINFFNSVVWIRAMPR